MNNNNNNDIKTIGIPFHNVRSWYFRRTFHGPDHWDVLVEVLQNLINRELEYFEPSNYWFEISNDQVANVIAVVRGTVLPPRFIPEPFTKLAKKVYEKFRPQPDRTKPILELSLNRTGDLFCISLSVADFYDAEQHECADHAADHLDTVIREVLDDVYANPF